ncbi:RagB/SusD family nutrient uptake outer membrane protein [Pedobacter helvus]|uniref:RagB/SusD family nutrient uptake outer membrane protein n=1 Tax=Pedobacter helvus TaxID=2563444 RepID=A0ABW9JMI0_9SPHI|nr:RagB/SusD family nutrient uptake outer membrane protein [Pedobacter ureilyticus]
MSKKYFILLIIPVLIASACGKLDEKIYSSLTPEVYFRNAGDAKVALYGVYNTLNRQHFYTNDLFVMSFLPSKYVVTRLGTHKPYASFNFAVTDPRISRTWASLYLTISRANAIIDRVPGIDMDENLKAQYVGEAKFLRAMSYFYLVRLFGGVPLKIKETTGIEGIHSPRASVQAVYDQIIEDLKYAETGLPPIRPITDRGRATRAAAKTLLGKVYLTMAGYPLKQTDKWALARTKLKEVIDEKDTYGIDLLPVFKDVFDVAKEAANKEAIFAIQFSNLPDQGSALAFFAAGLNSDYATSYGQYNYGFTTAFRNLYLATDTRRDVTALWSYRAYNGATVTYQTSTYYRDPSGLALGKYQDGPAGKAASNVRHANDMLLLRYADVLLMYAEAENEVNGPGDINDPNSAYAYLNKVRARSSAALQTTVVSQVDFRNLIYLERVKELSGELHEYYDVQRLERLKDHMDNSFEVSLAGMVYNTRAYLYPIPDDEIAVNNAISPSDQNPGY